MKKTGRLMRIRKRMRKRKRKRKRKIGGREEIVRDFDLPRRSSLKLQQGSLFYERSPY